MAEKNWYTHPKRSTLLVLFTFWLVSIIFLTIAATDSFNSPINWDAIMLMSPIICGSTAFVYEMGIKFLKNRFQESKLKKTD